MRAIRRDVIRIRQYCTLVKRARRNARVTSSINEQIGRRGGGIIGGPNHDEMRSRREREFREDSRCHARPTRLNAAEPLWKSVSVIEAPSRLSLIACLLSSRRNRRIPRDPRTQNSCYASGYGRTLRIPVIVSLGICISGYDYRFSLPSVRPLQLAADRSRRLEKR